MWVKVDDKLPDHPKFGRLMPFYRLMAQHLHLNALCWCNQHLTDGRVPWGIVNRLGSDIDALRPFLTERDLITLDQVVESLLAVGLWDKDETGDYRIHNYLKYQPSRAAVLAEREANRVRKMSGRNPEDVRKMSGRNPGGIRAEKKPPVPVPDPDLKDQDLGRSAHEQPRPPSRRVNGKFQPKIKGAWGCDHTPICRSRTKCLAQTLAEVKAEG